MSDRPIIRVQDVMTSEVIKIAGTATVHEAITIMRDRRVSSLVVDRQNDHDEIGLIVVADIAEKVVAVDRSPERVSVFDVMSKPVLTVAAGMQIKYAARMLVRFKLTRAVVVDEHREPIGIVTLRDMVVRLVEQG